MNDATPADLLGTVHEVQHALREQYRATACEIDTHDKVHVDRGPDGDGITHVDEDVRAVLTWKGDDLWEPKDSGPSHEAVHAEQLADLLADVQADYPDADVSAFIDGEHIRLNLTVAV